MTPVFYHDMDSFLQKTIALVLPSREELFDAITRMDDKVKLQIGWSKVHPKDRYTKAIGRKVAAEKLVPAELMLTGISPSFGHHWKVELEGIIWFHGVRHHVQLVLFAKSNRSHLGVEFVHIGGGLR